MIHNDTIAIVPTADRQKATVKVRIGFDELDPRILPDMGVKVAFQGGSTTTAQRAVVLPREAIRSQQGRDVVFVVQGGQVERRAVSIDPTEGPEVVILSGVTTGERVVLEGPADLEDGDKVSEDSP